METHYDYIVIGGGSGGSASARRAAGYGAKVMLIERGASWDTNGIRRGAGFGGTCVNVGCIPKKLMFNVSVQREGVVGSTSTAKGNCLTVPNGTGVFDWACFKKRRDDFVKKLNKTYANNWDDSGIEVVIGIASFIDAQTVAVESPNDELNDGGSPEKREFTANKILVACGGEPDMPKIAGVEHCITSDGFFDLEQQPKKVAVVGGGYIAVEMAGILNGLGSDCHFFFRGDTVLRRGFDPNVISELMKALEQHGPNLYPNHSPTEVNRDSDSGTLTVTFEHGKKDSKDLVTKSGFDCVLLAVGRRPKTGSLNLSAAGVQLGRKGYIEVDRFENTSTPGVYAIGDATTSGYELTPVAIASGRRLADRLFGGEPRARLEYSDIATVIFSHPPLGSVGLTEPKAKEEYGADQISTKQARFSSLKYAMNGEGHEEDGTLKVKTIFKLVLLGPEERVVGLHCLGPNSDELLQGFAVALKMGATRRDFEAAVAIHPTSAEELVTFGDWGQKVDPRTGQAKPILPPSTLGDSDMKPYLLRSEGIALGAAALGLMTVAVIAMQLPYSSTYFI